MAQDEKDIILEIEVKYEDAINGIAKYRKQVDDLKKSNDDLKKQLKEGEISQTEYNKAISANKIVTDKAKEGIRLLEKEIKNNIKTEKEQEGSLVSLRAALSNLTKEYDSLSRAEREGAKGKELQDKINAVTDELNEAEQATQRFYRNVGNYEEAMTKAIGANGGFAGSLMNMAKSAQSGGGFITALTSKVKAFFAVIIANPIMAILAAVIVIFNAFKKAVNSSEEATARWNAILAPLGRALQFLMGILQKVVEYVLKGVEAYLQMAMAVSRLMEKLPFVGKYFKEANDQIAKSIELEKEKHALDKLTRDSQLKNAQANKEIAELRAEAENKQKYSAQERLEMIQKANKIEQEIADRNLALAQERLRLFEEEYGFIELSKEQAEELLSLQEAVINADIARLNKQKENQSKISGFHSEAVAQAKERRDKEREAIRAAEDAALALVKEGIEKQRQILNQSYARQIEDLRIRLTTEKNLTAAAKQAITDTIISLEKQQEVELAKLSDEETANRIAKETQRVTLMLEVTKAGTQHEFDLRRQLLEQNRQAEIAANNALTEEMRQSEADINAKYAKQESDLRNQQMIAIRQEQSKAIQLEWQNRLLAVQQGSMEEYALKVQAAQAEYDFLLNLDAEQKAAMFESDLEYTNAVLENKKKIEDATNAQTAAQQNAVRIQLQAAQAIGGGFEDVLNSFAENNEALAEFAKTVAMFNIGLSTAEAIAAVPSMATMGDPYTYALRVAAAIATVMANIGKAKQILSKEKTPKAPKLATGGIVKGPGSGTSDSVQAFLSNGESVNTALATSMFSPLYSALNQLGGGVPIAATQAGNQVMGEDMLARAFAKAVATLPNPIVAVEEINSVQSKVTAIETLRVQ